MEKGIFISIKPEYMKKIESGEKNYEFRKYIPKEPFHILYVYESTPTSSLKYILTIDKIVKYPEKITEKGYGNNDFNQGLKESKYAYHIQKVSKLVNPIPLEVLKTQFKFTPPERFAYASKYPELVKYLNDINNKIL